VRLDAAYKPVLANFSISRTSTAEQIAEALNDSIVRGELLPGSRVRESALATRLGVSRNTVREAARIVEQRGLIQYEVNRGAIVKRVSVEDTNDLYRVRELLELSAIAETRKSTDLSGVEQALTEFRTALRTADRNATVERDLGFHAAIVGLLGSPRLNRLFADLRHQLRFYLAVVSVEDRELTKPNDLIEQHGAVLRALQAGNRAQARTLLRDHLRISADRVAAVLRERQSRDRA
jgi:DNA-binding GntR family transcriptional regulator